MKMKIKLKIQSFSDIITNSSSEIFCTIQGKDNLTVEYLWRILGNQCVIYETDNENEFNVMLDYDAFYDTIPQTWLERGITAIMDEHLGKENYEIIFD